MKSQALYASAVFFIASLFSTSCTKKQEITTNNISFDTISVARVYHLNNDSTQPSCNLKINFVYPLSYNNDKEALHHVQKTFISLFFDDYYTDMTPAEAVEKYTVNYIDNYKEDARIFFKEKDNDRSEDASMDNYFSYYETLSNKITLNKANLVAFQIIQTNYKGGTNSYKQLKNHVLNLETGRLLTEEDIFDTGYEKVLNAIFKDRLKSENKVNNLHDLEDLGYFGIEEIMPNNNFLVDEKGITYVFNKNEYSVIQLPEINIFIPFNELSLVLKTESPISAFSQK